jgi:micrococcal nuclease
MLQSRRLRKVASGLGAAWLTAAPTAGCALQRGPATHPVPPAEISTEVRRVDVAYVIDGDTIVVTARGRRIRVRLLGLDAPEATRRHGCFGRRALRRLLPVGAPVVLASDRRRTDTYGRELGYVWRADGMFINRELIRRGFATTLFLPPPGPFRAEFTAAEAMARGTHAGLWRVCPRRSPTHRNAGTKTRHQDPAPRPGQLR